MKLLMVTATVLLVATPLFAQERGGEDARGYITGLGGFTRSVGSSTGDTLFEGGVRIARRVMLFGNIGRFGDLKADLQPTLDTTANALATNQGLDLTGAGSLPAKYGVGGLRVELPAGRRVFPYLMAGMGIARLTPTAQFSFSGGVMPDGSTPDVGTDVTAAIVTAGVFTAPAASTALMTTMGAGLQIPLAKHWVADAGYRYARIAADTTLSATPLNTNGMTFGIGYRF